MKTINFFLIVALLAAGSLTYPQSATPDNPFSVTIPLKNAIHNPMLVKAMYEQLNQDFLNSGTEEHLYYATVRFKNNRYVIYGTYAEWISFFLMDPTNPKPENTLESQLPLTP
jgi:hypothetical protein